MISDSVDIAKVVSQKVEHRMKTAIMVTDWNRHKVLEVVVAHDPVLDGTIDPMPDIVVNRYEDKAPPMDEAAIKGKRCEVQRMTKPLLRKRLPELGENPAKYGLE